MRLVGDMLAAELSRTLEQLSARQREDMASLVLNHAQGMRATTDRVDRLLRGLEADRERGGSVDRSVLERLDAIAARQDELETAAAPAAPGPCACLGRGPSGAGGGRHQHRLRRGASYRHSTMTESALRRSTRYSTTCDEIGKMRAEKQKVLFEDDWNPIRLSPDLPPVLLVVVDAEEEFDWSGPFRRDHHSVRSMAAQGPMHRIFEKYGIRPTYVVDYPVASQRDGFEPLRDLLNDDACLIGTQLHPWVNPPFDEEISERNSFPGNLPPDLERAKLAVLTRAIEDGLGLTPRIYKAGRYGLGPKTFRTLTELGYQIDISAVPGADLRTHYGPDFRQVAPQPYWIGPAGRLLELPLTRGYVGLLSDSGPRLEGALESPLAQAFRLPGVFPA